MTLDGSDRDLFHRIQDKVAVVGIGHLPFAKDIGRPISDTAVEAIQLALNAAGGDRERAAERLGISARNLGRRLRARESGTSDPEPGRD